MLFGNKKLCDVSFSINKENITRVFQAKFIIQSNLKWSAHITSIANKISKTIGVINKAKHVLDTCHLKMLYQCLIEPYLNHCCIVWANPVKNTALESLFKVQKRSVRIICFARFNANTLSLFQELSVLSICDLCLIQILIYVYKSINLLLPNHLTNYFTQTSSIHSHSTPAQKRTLYRLHILLSNHAVSTVLPVVDQNTGINYLTLSNRHLLLGYSKASSRVTNFLPFNKLLTSSLYVNIFVLYVIRTHYGSE